MHALLTDFATLRRTMVDSQLRPSEIIEPRLVAAMTSVAREEFVPAARRDAAYGDRSIPLGNDASGSARALNPPLTTARLIDAARVQPDDRVLLIGAATGYCAAVLHAMGAQVVAVESDAALVAMARTALAALADTPGVTLIEGPLAAPIPDTTPFDVLLIDGAVATLPATLTAQLVDGARIACGWTSGGMTRLARGVHVAASTAMPGLVGFADFECVPLPGFSLPPRFEF